MAAELTRDELVAQYELSHRHPVNRVCHTFGIPMIVLALVLGLLSLLYPSLWRPAWLLFVAGWVLQFIGHAFEGKPPEFLKNWRFLFVGLSWWYRKITGRI
jgi:uncharacterized membrane protein YGL010W